MGKTNKSGLRRLFSWEGGQRLFNFAYSIGAAIVILGALFKILHLPLGNELLMIGMATEVVMFIITAFDRPPKEYKWEDVFPVLNTNDPEDRPDFSNGGGGVIINGGGSAYAGEAAYDDEGNPIVVTNVPSVSPEEARRAVGLPSGVNISEEDTLSLTESIAKMAAASDQLSRMAELTSATQQYLDQMAAISEEMLRLRETTQALNKVSDVLLESYRAITENSENITSSSTGYIEQMQDLNRNIGGLNTIYEIQLKSVSSQLDSIDRVNRGIKDIRDMYEKSSQQSARYCEETEKMARYMQQLNSVYEKMITAMTINMYRPMMGGDIPGMQNPNEDSSNS